MAVTGLLLAGFLAFWPLLIVAFVGTMNPSAGDVSVFLPLEHARLAETAHGEARTKKTLYQSNFAKKLNRFLELVAHEYHRRCEKRLSREYAHRCFSSNPPNYVPP